jgi:uncharacterized protein with PIN domain
MSDRVYEVEVKTYWTDKETGERKREWVLTEVWKAKQRQDVRVRCKECRAPVKLMSAGPGGVPAAHAEHYKRFPGCSLSDAFDGICRLNPDAID